MEVIHNLGILSIKKNVNEDVGFSLANKKGSYCSFFNTNSSRYLGLFYFDEKSMNMYRFIESIEIIVHQNAESIKNGFYFAERRKGNFTESFLMPSGFNSLIYELNVEGEIDLVLDCKNSYDNREWGRNYNIFEEDGCVVAGFTKKTDRREDSSDGIEEFSLYMAVKSNRSSFSRNDKWIERDYFSDEKRNSRPFRRYVYNAIRIQGARFVFSMSKNKNEAVKECNHVFKNLEEIKNNEKKYFFEILNKEPVKNAIKNEKISNEAKVAYINALISLNNLAIAGKINCGLFAGLPWFFQFWSRDTLVSLKALSKINNELADKALLGYLDSIGGDGRLHNLAGKHESIKLGNTDSHGWLFFRCKEMAEKMNKNKEIINSIKSSINAIKQSKSAGSERVRGCMRKFKLIVNKKEDSYHKMLYEIESSLEKSLNGLLKSRTKDSFEENGSLETWMDTDFGDEGRKGTRIEIQALRLNMYRLMFELTQNQKYRIIEDMLKNKVKEKFWNGKILADGLNDFTARPNIFIAAYAYPGLMSNKEWETCFDSALKNLWLEWGGLSTIDRNNQLFTDESTGENIKSYHRGDSWFWINNLTALVLSRINKNKFDKQIKKIIEASTKEILWKGCIGCHSELSSAKELRSEGTFNQAWSNAMFIELIDEISQ